MVLLECVERVRAERFARVVPLCRLCEMTEMIINEFFENQFGENCSDLFNSRGTKHDHIRSNAIWKLESVWWIKFRC